jgi:Concanavalin A-like lectin/glucanases superfamily
VVAVLASSTVPTKYLYVDGTLDATAVTSGVLTANIFDVTIGENLEQFVRWFDGNIDDVRIYNRALTADEVKQLYNAGR